MIYGEYSMKEQKYCRMLSEKEDRDMLLRQACREKNVLEDHCIM